MTNTQDQQPKLLWKSPADRKGHVEAPQPPEVSRRGFLEAAGFTLSLAASGGCGRAPQQHALPMVSQPAGFRAGRLRQYASTCLACSASCGLLVGVRDGRPLKMEGMPEHPLSRGGLCAVGQAQALALYDSHRLTGPLHDGEAAEWSDVDQKITDALSRIKQDGGSVRVVTPTTSSPTLDRIIAEFLAPFADGQHVVFDPCGASAILDAHEKTHGQRLLPRFRLDRAKMVVSFDADFLGTWISPVEHTAAWMTRRSLPHRSKAHGHQGLHHEDEHATKEENGDTRETETHEGHDVSTESTETPPVKPAEMAYHVQLESRMTLTGSNADKRIRLHPKHTTAVLRQLIHRVETLAGKENAELGDGPSPLEPATLDELAAGLWQHRGESIVLCGENDVAAQLLVNQLNQLLENYGQTVDVSHPSQQKLSNDADVGQLAKDLSQGKISALLVAGVDLTYYLPQLADSIKETSISISLSDHRDDIAAQSEFVCPDHHPLESWLDAEPVRGLYSLCQPTIEPLGNTRSALESLAAWSGNQATALELIKRTWRERVFAEQQKQSDFVRFWDQAVHDGFVQAKVAPEEVSFQAPPVSPVDRAVDEGLTLVLHPATAIPDSRHAHNPWLQELPDPITKITWDNCLSISPGLASERGLQDHDVVQLSVGNGASLELPVFVQPGQHDQVIAISLGYGVPGTNRFRNVGPQWIEGRPTLGVNGLVGVSASPLLTVSEGGVQLHQEDVRLEKTGRRHVLATTQLHDSIEVPHAVAPPGSHDRRALVQETTLDEFNEDPAAGAPHGHHFDGQLWAEDHPYDGHRWGMSIDLNRCTGCSACLIACQAENNVPVVGRDEVRRHREMHWIRIDRYYSGAEDEPDVTHQPMMCQHCANAPCETVCPVLATVHSSEGLNQQVYNRCVGTRYCANNCPYKVRRFNWFDYAHDDTLQNLALNPDVTVRIRGIMEKCSMCVHRIQEGKIDARSRGQRLADGAIQTACQQSCPADAIVFGDMNDPTSRVAQAAADARQFRVLEELNVQPQVAYLRKVRNRSQEEEGV